MRNKMFSKALIVLLAVILSFSTMLLLAYAATNVGISVTNLSAAYENGTVQSHNGSASWSGSGTSLSGSVTGQDAGSSGSGWCATSWSAGASDSTLTFTSSSTYPATLSFNYSLGLNDGTVIIDGVNKTQDGSFSKSLTNGQTVAVKITSATAEKTTSINITNISMTVNPVSLTAATANSTMGTASVDPMSVTPPGTATWTATSITGYRFVRWTNSSGEGVSAETSYTVEGITEATTFTANFEAIPLTTVTFAPAVSVSGDEDGGSYTVSGSTISGIQTLAYNSSSISVADYITSSVVLVATPKSSVYAFDG